MTQHNSSGSNPIGDLVSFDAWLASLDKTRTTGWRWRKGGVVKTENVFGKLYISREEISRFEARAAAGEFHREANVPKRTEVER